jgi:polyhydroxybutyrate depolymerase
VKRLAILMLMAACGSNNPGGGDDDGTAPDAGANPPRVYGGDRPVELQLPTNYDPSQHYPLVILLHGYSATGLLQSAYLGLADIPTDPGAFYMTPDGEVDTLGNHYWNAGDACCIQYADNPPDDVAYIGGLIDDVMRDWPVDPTRVIVMGHSNGGFMTYRMACERADVITAGVVLAGAMTSLDGADCTPAEHVSILHVHGTADQDISYTGGTALGGAEFPGAVTSVTLFAGKDGCDTTLADGDDIDLVRDIDGAETHQQIAGCTGGVGVELWTMNGGGHIPNFVSGGGTMLAQWAVDHPRAQ